MNNPGSGLPILRKRRFPPNKRGVVSTNPGSDKRAEEDPRWKSRPNTHEEDESAGRRGRDAEENRNGRKQIRVEGGSAFHVPASCLAAGDSGEYHPPRHRCSGA
jgi:hypothetical protein